MSQDDVYFKLRKFLDNMPGGFPATESGVEIKILKKFFTPEEAALTLYLKPMPEPASAIAARAGMSEAETTAMLEKMSKEGSIYRVNAGDKNLFMAISFAVGVYEFHVNGIDRELAELVEEYMPHLSQMWYKTQTKQLRVVPVGAALKADATVATYDQIRELVKKQEIACVSPCICRKEKTLLGHQCEKPQDLCFQFGVGAKYYLENGIGRQISIEEALKLLDYAQESALVPSATNAQNVIAICCCCGCCCGVLTNLKKLPRPADQVSSTYQAKIDPDDCTACGTCLERCQIDAIIDNGDFMEVDQGRCIGCGLCIPTCPTEAIRFVDKAATVTPPPKSMFHLMMQIAKERGLM